MIGSIAQFVLAAAVMIFPIISLVHALTSRDGAHHRRRRDGQLYHTERRRFVIEPDAALIILLVRAVLTSLYWLR